MLKKLKQRWGISSNIRLILIFIAFSVTGSLAVKARFFVFDLLNIGPETNLFVKIILSILIITPSYQVLLVIVGSLLGQFEFFWRFEKKMIGRFIPKKKEKPVS